MDKIKSIINILTEIDAKRILFGALCLTSGACYTTCAVLLELGDHAAGLLCYAGCSAFLGFASYRGFRTLWQEVSIPMKDYILSFFVTKK